MRGHLGRGGDRSGTRDAENGRPHDGVRLTRRGYGVLVAGLAAAGAGVSLGVVALAQVALLLLGAVAVSVAMLVTAASAHRRGQLRATRTVRPHPVSVGTPATVTIEVTARPPASTAWLEVSERAARELSGGKPLRARVTRGRSALTLTYALAPAARGRWPVGPLRTRRDDLFGLAQHSGTLGEPLRVAVRPRTTPLRVRTSAMAHETDRATSGTRTPAADDALLRGYVAGDDLRRVHWPSSARRGELLVRRDEASARRPATVLLDLAEDGPTTEWSIELAASIAIALTNTGHHVRLLAGDRLGTAADHHRPEVGAEATDALLDTTVDLHAPLDQEQRQAWFRAAVDTLHTDAAGSELVLAVVGALPPAALTALAATGETTRGHALVRTGTEHSTETAHEGGADPEAEHTAARLRRAGWTVCLVRPGEDLAACWERLLAADDSLLAAR